MKRIDFILSNSGVLTRSEARRAVMSGRVAADGVTVKQPSDKVDDDAVITLDGAQINTEKYVYIMINKPAGTVCSNEGDDSVLTLVPDKLRRRDLFTVGRLDKDTEGLLLITNDGAFAHSVTAPAKSVEKVYYAELSREVKGEDIKRFASGLRAENGEEFLPAKLEKYGENAAFVTVNEGKYHEVKRLFLITGNSVTYLKRVKTGALSLDETLKKGECRALTEDEKRLATVTNV